MSEETETIVIESANVTVIIPSSSKSEDSEGINETYYDVEVSISPHGIVQIFDDDGVTITHLSNCLIDEAADDEGEEESDEQVARPQPAPQPALQPQPAPRTPQQPQRL